MYHMQQQIPEITISFQTVSKFCLHLIKWLFWEVEIPHCKLEGVDDDQIEEGDDDDPGDDEEEHAGEETEHLEVDALEELLEGDPGLLDPLHPLLRCLLPSKVHNLQFPFFHRGFFQPAENSSHD